MVSDFVPMLSSSYSESSMPSYSNSSSPVLGRMRRSSHRTSSCSFSEIMETVEIRGQATLCFDETGTRFQGVIVADDRSLYSIQGKKTPRNKSATGKFMTL